MQTWKSIPNFEGEYEVSNDGKIKSLKRKVKCRNGLRSVNERILKPKISHGGYLNVQLKNKGKFYSIHTLVLISFFGNKPDPSFVCNHKDGNKLNNNIENLEWVTRSENQLHAFRTGLQKKISIKGEKNKMSKTIYAYNELGKLVHTCIGVSELARKLNLRKNSIFRVLWGIRKYYNNLHFTYEKINGFPEQKKWKT